MKQLTLNMQFLRDLTRGSIGGVCPLIRKKEENPGRDREREREAASCGQAARGAAEGAPPLGALRAPETLTRRRPRPEVTTPAAGNTSTRGIEMSANISTFPFVFFRVLNSTVVAVNIRGFFRSRKTIPLGTHNCDPKKRKKKERKRGAGLVSGGRAPARGSPASSVPSAKWVSPQAQAGPPRARAGGSRVPHGRAGDRLLRRPPA